MTGKEFNDKLKEFDLIKLRFIKNCFLDDLKKELSDYKYIMKDPFTIYLDFHDIYIIFKEKRIYIENIRQKINIKYVFHGELITIKFIIKSLNHFIRRDNFIIRYNYKLLECKKC